MNSRFFQRLHIFREAIRWRGLLITALVVAREIFRPFIYCDVWHIFETDISREVPEPYGKEDVVVKIFTAEDKLTIAQDEICAELERDRASLRFTRGDRVGMAFLKDQPVGYMWIALSSGLELALDTQTYWVVRPCEAVRYGSFVLPAFRGRGVHSCLNTAVNSYLRNHGITRTLGSVSLLNPQSMSLPKHYDRPIAMTVFVARIRGVNWIIRRSFRAPLESRFSWPQD